jgi:hypothetical protein
VTKSYDARLATRITSSVDTRLRQLALLHRRRISHLLDDVLDQALPSAEDLAARFAHPATTPEPASPDPPAISLQPDGTGPGGTAIPAPHPGRSRREAGQ